MRLTMSDCLSLALENRKETSLELVTLFETLCENIRDDSVEALSAMVWFESGQSLKKCLTLRNLAEADKKKQM